MTHIVPVTILTGFLGAGKTTLLNTLLKDPALSDTAVIINEFGEISLDHLLVETSNDGIIELSSGCLCCTIRGELITTLETLIERVDQGGHMLSAIIIETTGLADPVPVMQVVMNHPTLSHRIDLGKVITVADAINGPHSLETYPEAVRQVAISDHLIISKSDMADHSILESFRQKLETLNPDAIISIGQDQTHPQESLENTFYNLSQKPERIRNWFGHRAHHHHHNGMESFTVETEQPMSLRALQSFLELLASTHGSKLLRLKGLVKITEHPDQPMLLHGVQSTFHQPVKLPAWPDDNHHSRLVIIADGLERDFVIRLLDGFTNTPGIDTPDQTVLMDNPLSIAGFKTNNTSGKMKIAVAGAGLAGLAAATWLTKAGHDVVIFETEERIGGRACTIKRPDNDDIVDTGTQYFHTNYKRALALVREVGLKRTLHKINGKTQFFDERVKSGSFVTGHRIPYIASGSPWANAKMTLGGLVTLFRYPIDPFAVAGASGLDDVAASDKITAPFEREYKVRTLVSAGALIEPDFSEISYLQLIRLMRIIVTTDYLTLNGGIHSLHQALADKLDIRFNSPVASLITHGDEICGLQTKDGAAVDCDHVILATTPKATANILPKDWTEETAYLSGIHQPPALTVTLFLDAPLQERIWSYVFRPDNNKLVSFCVDAAQKNPAMLPSGKAALQAWICYPAAEKIMASDDKTIIDEVVKELAGYFPNLASRVEHTVVHRVPHAIPQAPPGHNARTSRFLKSIDDKPGLEVCGDYLSGGYMECTLWSAERAVKNILRSLKVR